MSPPLLTPGACPACKRKLRVTAPVFAEALARVRCPLPGCGAQHFATIATSDVSLLDAEAAERAMELRRDPYLPWQGASRLRARLQTVPLVALAWEAEPAEHEGYRG